MLKRELLAILVCPQCKGGLRYEHNDPQKEELICDHCRLAFPVKDDIPIMLVEEARKIK
jgi:uncharacterized protein YbaR (Trm112 family)